MIKIIRTLVVALFVLTFTMVLNAGEQSLNRVDDFTLTSYDGSEHSLSDYRDSKAVVIMFVATECPISNAYNSRMAALHKEYHLKGVTFLGINSNKQEGVEEIKKHAQENKFGFPVLKDHNNVLADHFKASVTPEIYVLNPKWEIVYHGRIDDSRREAEVTAHDLRTALDEVLAGKSVSTAHTKAFGCTIKRVSK